ncbi:DnaJ-like protein [Entomoplasma freundtii]|uniref:Uncharacterized protein n=1 Tax=Entomoplasma freundtii TaxID=74700 RepID=A0A2K8NRW5_9MOLU|nr:DnaJ domain-containing protein [Entomoplasma freundtii]ATZ16549.1 hypothetical protein EFREU_v1c05280 [Entomoplasma freundtii]TDY58285.1 DnaJ-like protein [Entomoplasma freundtii]
MNIVGIIFFILILLSLFSSGSGFLAYKSRRKRNYSQNQSQTHQAFEANKKVWQFNTQKTVSIPEYNYQENFTDFPFFSNYQETEAFLAKKNVSPKQMQNFMKSMKGYESQMARYWTEQQRRLLRAFDQAGLNTSPEATEFALKYYNLFLDAFRHEVINYLANKILVAEVGRALNEEPKVMPQGQSYDHYIKGALDYFYMILNDDVNKIIDSMNQEIRSQYAQFFWQSDEARNQSHSAGASFQAQFDEVGQAYKTLETKQEATDDELKSNYRKLAKKYHPDRNPSQEAKEKMAKINSAYDLLKKIRNM